MQNLISLYKEFPVMGNWKKTLLSGHPVNYLCVCFNSELLRYQDIHAFAKTDTENAELASKDAQTAAFSASTQKPV